MRNMRSGFTLVELLMVIVITGILVVGMMIVQSAGENRARVTAMLTDLRVMSFATILWQADNPDITLTEGNNYIDRLLGYADNPNVIQNAARYSFCVEGKIWWIGALVDGVGMRETFEKRRISDKLSLYGSNSLGGPPQPLDSELYQKSFSVVWMRAK